MRARMLGAAWGALVGVGAVWVGMLAFAAGAWAGEGTDADESNATAPVARKLALSISGGVSLGGYESGAVWTWLRYLRMRSTGEVADALGGERRATLAGITGASAGGINTLVSALIWCSDDSRASSDDSRASSDGSAKTDAIKLLGTVDDNLLARAWDPVGFDTLLPPEAGADAFFALDGLLTRNAFAPSIALLQAAFDAPAYRPGCRIPFAVTVTRGRPWQTRVAGLTVANQRFALPLALTVDETGRAWFVNNTDVLRNEAQLGQYLLLAERTGAEEQARRGRSNGRPPPWVVPADVVLQAVLASSAFPLAFSPVVLPQCIPTEYCPPEVPAPPLDGFDWLGCGARADCGDFTRLSCAGLATDARPLALCASRFVDGGFFDNVPLGPAMAQAELDLTPDEAAIGVEYLYFDPDVRRLAAQVAPSTPDDGDRGISRVMQVLGDAVGTARAYELYSTLRFETFNTGPGTIVGGFARLYAQTRALIGRPTGAPSEGPLDACLAALDAQHAAASPAPSESCPPLPPECTVAQMADPHTRVPPSSGIGDPPVLAPEDCLPSNAEATAAGLTHLARRLTCRAVSDRLTATEAAEHRALTAAVVHHIAAIDACFDAHPAERNARLDLARLDRDLAEARRFLADASSNATPVRRLVLPTRFPPLAAGQLRNFGAFFDRPLRRYDYWAGVHDGLRNLALWRCDDRLAAAESAPDPAATSACVDAEYETLRQALLPAPSPIGARLLDELSLQERIVAAASAHPAPPRTLRPRRRRLRAPPRLQLPRPRRARRLPRPRRAHPLRRHRSRHLCPRPHPILRWRLRDHRLCRRPPRRDYPPRSSYMRLLLGAAGAVGPMLEALARLEAIERDEAARANRRAETDASARAVHRAGASAAERNALIFAAGGTGLRRVERVHDTFEFDPSTVPPGPFSAASLLPYRLGVDALHGGFALGWEPRLGGGRAVEGRFIIDAVRWRDDGGGWRSTLNPAIALRAWDSSLVGALGVGPIVERPWHEAGFELGAVAHLDLIADSVRLGVGRLFHRFPDADGASTEPSVAWTVDVWLLDLPGLAWLLTR
jgi:hypothetical protein